MAGLAGTRINVDANALIYFTEAHPSLGPPVKALFAYADTGACTLVTSELTRAEVLVLPMRHGNQGLIESYRQILAGDGPVEMLAITRAVLEAGAALRARGAVRLPDAIHLASAASSGCDFVVTADQRMRPDPPLAVLEISQIPAHLHGIGTPP